MRAGAVVIIAAMMADRGVAAPAITDPICADRPGKSTPTCTVAAGHWQVETGLADWALQKGGGERDTDIAIGETTVRYGLDAVSDIHIDFVPFERVTSRAGGVHQRASGVGDVTILYKRRLTRADGPVQVAIMPVVKVPVAKKSIGNGKWEGGLLLPIDFAISDSLGLNLTPEIDASADADGHGAHAAIAQVASLGWQATDKLSISAELWAQWDWDPSGTTLQASTGASAAYLASKDVQIDAGASLGLNRVTPDVELYAGVAKRF